MKTSTARSNPELLQHLGAAAFYLSCEEVQDLILQYWFSRLEEHTSELQSLRQLVCRLLLEKKKWRVDNGEGGRLRRNGPRPRVGAEDVWPTGRAIERDNAPTEGPGDIPDRPGSGHRIHDELTRTRIPANEVRGATGRADSVERGVARIGMTRGRGGAVRAALRFQVGWAEPCTTLG